MRRRVCQSTRKVTRPAARSGAWMLRSDISGSSGLRWRGSSISKVQEARWMGLEDASLVKKLNWTAQGND